MGEVLEKLLESILKGWSRVISTVGAEPVETRFFEGIHFYKGDLGSLVQDWQSHLRQW